MNNKIEWLLIFITFFPILALGQYNLKSPTNKSLPVTSVRPMDNDYKYPSFQDSERKQEEIRKQLFDKKRKEVNENLDEYIKLSINKDRSNHPHIISNLGYSDNPIVYPILINALNDSDMAVVAAAADGLRIYGDKQAIKDLLQNLDRSRDVTRLSIATALFALGEKTRSKEVLTACLRDTFLWMQTTYRLADELGAQLDCYNIIAKGIEGQPLEIQEQALSYFMIRAGERYKTFPIILLALQDKRQTFVYAATEGILNRKMIYGPLSCADALPILKQLKDAESLDWGLRTRSRVFAEEIEEAIDKQ